MFSPPPFLASYTAPGAPLSWEPIRWARDDFFNFAGGAPVRHWPDFSTRADAERMLAYVRTVSPDARLINILGDDVLPPGVGLYPVPLTRVGDPPGEISAWTILAETRGSRILASGGWLADAQTGLRSGLQPRYISLSGMNVDNNGQIVSGQTAWPWDAVYAYVSPEFPGEAQLYWANSSTGPLLG